jgi:hypothetical protein
MLAQTLELVAEPGSTPPRPVLSAWSPLGHLMRLPSAYLRYYHEDRTNLGLDKHTPSGRVRSRSRGPVIGDERLGGLHHRHDRAA